jgi:hypothetical protein
MFEYFAGCPGDGKMHEVTHWGLNLYLNIGNHYCKWKWSNLICDFVSELRRKCCDVTERNISVKECRNTVAISRYLLTSKLNPCSRVVLRMQSLRYWWNPLAFTEYEDSLPCSQGTATNPYTEYDESNPRIQTVCSKMNFNIMFLPRSMSFMWSLHNKYSSYQFVYKLIFKVSVNTTSLFNYKKLKHLNKSQYIKLYYNSL